MTLILPFIGSSLPGSRWCQWDSLSDLCSKILTSRAYFCKSMPSPQTIRHTSDKLVPIPFIVDTSAPAFMYLRTGCWNRLAQLGLLEELHALPPNPYVYQLRGTLYRGSNRVFKPPATLLPPKHESVPLINDHRLNLLGLRGVKELGGKLCMWCRTGYLSDLIRLRPWNYNCVTCSAKRAPSYRYLLS